MAEVIWYDSARVRGPIPHLECSELKYRCHEAIRPILRDAILIGCGDIFTMFQVGVLIKIQGVWRVFVKSATAEMASNFIRGLNLTICEFAEEFSVAP